MNENTDIQRRTSITELVNAWRQSEQQIRESFAAIVEAQSRLSTIFGDERGGISIASYRHDSVDFEKPEAAIKFMKIRVWACLVDRLELRRILSLKRIAELDKQIESGEGLPEITVANVTAMLEQNLNMAGQFLEEKVHEVYEWLRPRGWRLTEYKTNQKSEAAGVGGKVIIGYAVQRRYGSAGGFQLNYQRRDEIRALDQVFHLLDKAPYPREYAGPLAAAIETTTAGNNLFETPYFRGRCFGNGNLHLELTRPDLVKQFNLIAGGMRIRPGQPTPTNGGDTELQPLALPEPGLAHP